MAVEFIMNKKYDALSGRPRKELHPNDIVTFGTGGTVPSAGSTFCNTVISAYFDFYVTNLYCWTSATMELSIQSGTSTVCAFEVCTEGNQFILQANRENPICKISGAATVSLSGRTGSTACVWISGVREPKFAYIETA